MPRPNILILMSDEHRADLTGFAGNSIVDTPVLDELAKTGFVFKNAYTPSPICAPARQCLMSGQLPKTCGCDGAWMDLTPNYQTFARQFAQHAYHTVCSGKLHHLGSDQMQGWTQRLSPDAEVYDKYNEGLKREEFLAYSQGKLTEKRTNEYYVKEARPEYGQYQRFDERATEDLEYFINNYFKDSSTNKNLRPVLLKLSLLQPHYPFYTSQELFNKYYNKVNIYHEKLFDHPVLSQSQIESPVNVTKDEIRRATATYYGMIETIDGYFGRILDALRKVGQNLDEWVIVFLSDHGEMLGQHGIWEKARYFEGSVRVPFVIRYPKMFKGGKYITENINLCDLFATLCDLANISVPPNLDSRSLKPLLEGKKDTWSNETISQIKRKGIDHVMIKNGDLKYQYYGEEIPEVLFDLQADPDETKNFINDEKYVASILAFRKRLVELGYGPNGTKNYKNAGYEPGVTIETPSKEKLWPSDSNPWQTPLKI